MQTATYPTEFEPQTPSNPASAACQAYLPILLTQLGRRIGSIRPLFKLRTDYADRILTAADNDNVKLIRRFEKQAKKREAHFE